MTRAQVYLLGKTLSRNGNMICSSSQRPRTEATYSNGRILFCRLPCPQPNSSPPCLQVVCLQPIYKSGIAEVLFLPVNQTADLPQNLGRGFSCGIDFVHSFATQKGECIELANTDQFSFNIFTYLRRGPSA